MSNYKVYMLLLVCISSLTTVYSQCSGTAQNIAVGYETVTVSPPGYPNGYATNLDCAWLGSTTISGAEVLFQVTDVTLSCEGDAVNVYDGQTSSDTQLLNNGCQTNIGPRNYPSEVATTGNVYTEFTSDGNTTSSEKGFLMYMISGKDLSGTACMSAQQSLIATDTEQYLTSPNFPNQYDNDMKCVWNITAQSRTNVTIEIRFIEIEHVSDCRFDSLEIQDLGSSVIKMCNIKRTWISQSYTSTGNSFKLTFISDSSGIRDGFLIAYRQTGDPVKKHKKSCHRRHRFRQ